MYQLSGLQGYSPGSTVINKPVQFIVLFNDVGKYQNSKFSKSIYTYKELSISNTYKFNFSGGAEIKYLISHEKFV